MRRFVICSLLGLCLAAGSPRPALAQSFFDTEWMPEATPAAVQTLLAEGTDLTARNAIRYDKLAHNYRAAVTLAAILLYWL